MRINNNISAIGAYNRLNTTDQKISKNLEKLSSGLRINRAADDAAGLTISEKMRAQIRGLGRAVQNTQDGVSLIQTAEGSLNEVHAMLQRMNELAVQAANGTNSSADLTNIQAELDAITEELDNISRNTKFNEQNLLDGSMDSGVLASGLKIQIGAQAGDTVSLFIAAIDSNMTDGTTGTVLSGIDVASTPSGAAIAIKVISGAISTVSTQRVKLGAMQNRFEHTINNLNNYLENLTSAESRIRDVDVAKEMADFTKNQILAQAGTSMLAQANQKPQSIMSLLQG